MSLYETTVLRAAGIVPDSNIAAAAMTRDNIFDMSQSAENAVLRPRDYGGIPLGLRAALAARIARLAEDTKLEAHYLAGADNHAVLADPAETGATLGLAHVVAFADKVAQDTRNIAAEDIEALKSAGMGDADIVRLCELVAFLAYQIRVVSGLRLMQGKPG